MSTLNKWVLAVLGGVLAAWAQESPAPASSLKVNFPADSPVALVSAGWGESRTDARGGALVLDLHTSLALRNSSQRRIRGIMLLVQAQEVTPGGKGSVAVPSLDVGPGETFPIRIDLRLLRPLMAGSVPLAEVSLDGVLFEDLSFYGPDRLNSRRTMTVWELEARRDRQHFKSVLEARGPEGLREAMVSSIARMAERPRLGVQVIRRGRATAVAAQERECNFAFLQIPESPLEPVSGVARVAGSEARAPRIEVRNRSDRPVRYFEIGWIIRDRDGREYLAGSVPAAGSGLTLAPGAKGRVGEDSALRFTRPAGQPLAIEAMTGFVSEVEFTDGTMWIPARAALDDPRLRSVLAPSAEEQRLADLYRRRGLAAVVNELKKF
ncbi:MAG: hypothetical protein ACM3S5_01850 [Rhodospirillales bacterium]